MQVLQALKRCDDVNAAMLDGGRAHAVRPVACLGKNKVRLTLQHTRQFWSAFGRQHPQSLCDTGVHTSQHLASSSGSVINLLLAQVLDWVLLAEGDALNCLLHHSLKARRPPLARISSFWLAHELETAHYTGLQFLLFVQPSPSGSAGSPARQQGAWLYLLFYALRELADAKEPLVPPAAGDLTSSELDGLEASLHIPGESLTADEILKVTAELSCT